MVLICSSKKRRNDTKMLVFMVLKKANLVALDFWGLINFDFDFDFGFDDFGYGGYRKGVRGKKKKK